VRKRSDTLLAVVLVLAGWSPAVLAESSVPVSPGSRETTTRIEGRCPTFSWTATDRAVGYELVVYDLEKLPEQAAAPTGDSAASVRPHLRIELPARASSWTPPAAHCLEREKAYAWSVRALVDGSESAWSEAHLFEVGAVPVVEELSEELVTLRRRLENLESGTAVAYVVAAPAVPPATAAAPAPLLPAVPPPIDSTAIQALIGDELSATAGIAAESRSPTGVAGVFRNSGSGGQLLSGQNATEEVFKVAGDGTVSAVKFVGDGSGLTGISGGGGGQAAVAEFSVSADVDESTSPATLSLPITAPVAGGKLLIGASVDVFAVDPDLVDCEISLDSTKIVGSKMASEIPEDCTSFAAVGGVTQGAHTVAFTIVCGNGTALDEATPWALWVPPPAAP
jgi:hypothetical protein